MPDSRRRHLLKTAGSLVVVGSLAGCAQEDEDDAIGTEGAQAQDETQQGQDEQVGALRVVHASPGAPNVDVSVGDDEPFTDVAYGSATSYATLEPETYQLQVTATEDPETIVYEEEITVEAGQVTTAVVFGQPGGGPDAGVQVELLEDELSDPGEGMARLRLFHAVPDAPPVTVLAAEGPDTEGQNQTGQQQAGGQPVVEALALGEYETVTVPAGDYSFEIVPATRGGMRDGNGPPQDRPMGDGNGPPQDRPTGDGNGPPQDRPMGDGNGSGQGQQMAEPVATVDATLEAGGVYSAFAIGYLDPEEADSDAAFELLLLEDAMGGERADGASQ